MGIVTAEISVTLDGFGAGPGQCLERPFGDLQEGPLHSWMFDHEEDNREERAAITDAGAFMMGRNMFDPGRGQPDPGWRGWWAEDPPYHAPVIFDGVPRTDLVPVASRTTPYVTHLTYRRP